MERGTTSIISYDAVFCGIKGISVRRLNLSHRDTSEQPRTDLCELLLQRDAKIARSVLCSDFYAYCTDFIPVRLYALLRRIR